MVPTVIAPRVEMTVFDLSWGHFIVVAVVALIVIGPKDLPGVLRTIGQWTTRVRRMAAEFQGQFQEALREAEMADLQKEIGNIHDTASGFASSLNNPVLLDDAKKWEPNPAPSQPATATAGTPEAGTPDAAAAESAVAEAAESGIAESGTAESGTADSGVAGSGAAEAGPSGAVTPQPETVKASTHALSAPEAVAPEPAGTAISGSAAVPPGAVPAADGSEGGDRP